jgi:hypothetical protein
LTYIHQRLFGARGPVWGVLGCGYSKYSMLPEAYCTSQHKYVASLRTPMEDDVRETVTFVPQHVFQVDVLGIACRTRINNW